MSPRNEKLAHPLQSSQEVISDITKDRLPDPILDGLSELHWKEVEASDPREAP